MNKRILIFSEEYQKVTKGLFNIWMSHALEASKNEKVDILLNSEHWGIEEARIVLANSNVSLYVLPFQMPSTVLEELTGHSTNIWLLRLGKLLNALLFPMLIFRMSLTLKKINAQTLYSHNGGWPAGQLCRWIIFSAWLIGVRNRFFIIHSHPATRPSFFRTFIPLKILQTKLVDWFASNIITVSDSVKSVLEKDIFKTKITRIHNGIDCELHLTKEIPTWTKDKVTVGFIGALYPHKGPQVLLDAFKLIENESELILIGPGETEYLNFLKKKTALIKNKVSFLGLQNHIDNYLKDIDILVVPSIEYESFGLIILEAMKHNKPVICSDYGGMKEIVVNGKTGFVVPSNDSLALANAIQILLKDVELRVKMGKEGRARLEQLFTAEKMAQQYLDLIN